MTAVSSENETDSRFNDHLSFRVGNVGEGQHGDPSYPGEGLEVGGTWDNGEGRDRDRGEGSGKGNANGAFSGTSNFNVKVQGTREDATKAMETDKDAGGSSRRESEHRHHAAHVRNYEVAHLAGDERDEASRRGKGKEGSAGDVGSRPHTQQGHLQSPSKEQAGKTDRSQLQQDEQTLPQNTPVATAGWESFLPQKQLRVLLAEDDDSTRHVVGALLRNCSYEVTSAANGMQAWEMLEDPNNRFDLVLTDVVMPCLSGVGLLTKIMSREAGKRVPVIMMSSHDSLDIVFRCLSKGAADFLVKPVRKNELKNLWQHVWRCQSSSGSGSGSGGTGSGTGKAVQPKSRVGSGNNSGSNDGSEDGSSGLNVRGGSDNGSGTQTVAVHVQAREKKQRRDREEGQATSFQKAPEDIAGQELDLATRRLVTAELQSNELAQHNGTSALDRGSPSSSNRNEARQMEEGSPSSSNRNEGDQMEEGYNSGVANSGGSAKAIDLINGIARQDNEEVKEGDDSDGVEGSDRGGSNSPVMNEKYSSDPSPPTLELSLKRSRAPGDEHADVEERRGVWQSGGSAFSRYSTSGVIIQQHISTNTLPFGGYPITGNYNLSSGQSCLGTGNVGQLRLATPLDRCGSSLGSGEVSTLANHPNFPTKNAGQDMGSCVVGSSGQEGYGQDMGSCVVGSSVQEGYGNCQQAKDEAASVSPASAPGMPLTRPSVPHPGLMYDGVTAAYGPSMHPAFYSHPAAAPPWATPQPRREIFDRPSFAEHGAHIPRHHSHHQPHHSLHHRHHRAHVPHGSVRPSQDEQMGGNQASGAGRCGSANIAGSAPDVNMGQSGSSNGYGSNGNGNGSVNGSVSGSNNLSNQNGQSGVPLVNGSNGESGSGNRLPGNAGIVDHEQNRFARREAALNKFRQKRKERCFEKKVRYQSRKRLAEQRPRVRGQFVRQALYDISMGEAMD